MPRLSPSYLSARLRHLILTSPPATSLFYARLWYALCPLAGRDHESLHVLALAFLQAGQPYCALHLVRDTADGENPGGSDAHDASWRRPGCSGCAMVVARCCDKLGRFTEGKAVLERALKRNLPIGTSSRREVGLMFRSTTIMSCFDIERRTPPHGELVAQGQSAYAGCRALWEGVAGGSVVVGSVHGVMRHRSVFSARAL